MLDAGSTNNDVGRIAVAIENASMTIGIDPRVILGIMYVILFPVFFTIGTFLRALTLSQHGGEFRLCRCSDLS